MAGGVRARTARSRLKQPWKRLQELIEPLRKLVTTLGLDVDPHVVNALGTCALLGWFVFRPLLAEGYGLPPDASAHVERLLTAIDRMFTAPRG